MDFEKLLALGCRSNYRIGIGLSREKFLATERQIKAIGCSLRLTRYSNPQSLVLALRDGVIDAGVRGTMSSSKMINELRKSFKVDRIMRAALMERADGKPFILAPVGIDEGRDYASRLELAGRTVDYFSAAHWRLSVGVLSKGRAEDSDRGTAIRRSLEEGERLARALKSRGIRVKHFSILIEDAVSESDLVIAPDGVSGNLIFRTLHFVGGGRAIGAPVVNLPKVFVDTSRVKTEYSDAIRLASGLAKVRERTHSNT